MMSGQDQSGSHDVSGGAGIAGARLTIDLDALCQNYHIVAQRAAPARAAAVVKADGYGLGAARVVQALASAGCTDFFVAHLSEALDLKPVIRDGAAIYILNGLVPGAETRCAQAGLIPVLNSVEQARAWQAAARCVGRRLPAVLQFDSGMSRLGMAEADGAILAVDADFRAHVDIVLTMSHLACADTPDHPANAAQLAMFTTQAGLFPEAARALANSGGIFLPSGFHADLVRAGIALYGGAPNSMLPDMMRPVVHLDALVIQTRTVPAGAQVGYGGTFIAQSESRLATLSLGYADGWHRALSNCGAAYHGAIRLPIVGRVSMDSITIDISALPPGALGAGDWVEMIGPHQTIDQVARDAGTISYEILTSLGRRFDRIYRDSHGASPMVSA